MVATDSPEKKKDRPGSTTLGRKTLVLKVSAPHARSVAVAGDFNSWKPKPMARTKDGQWKATFRPHVGTYAYKFVIDREWIEDPDNPKRTPDPYGGFNSICVVGSNENSENS